MSFYGNGLAVSFQKGFHLINEARATLYDGFGIGFLVHNADSDSTGCGSYFILNQFIGFVCCKLACRIVVCSRIGNDRIISRYSGVKANHRYILGSRRI